MKAEMNVIGALLAIVVVLGIALFTYFVIWRGIIFEPIVDEVRCPIITNGTYEWEECEFVDRPYCESMGCAYGSWSCGRPACYCDEEE